MCIRDSGIAGRGIYDRLLVALVRRGLPGCREYRAAQHAGKSGLHHLAQLHRVADAAAYEHHALVDAMAGGLVQRLVARGRAQVMAARLRRLQYAKTRAGIEPRFCLLYTSRCV